MTISTETPRMDQDALIIVGIGASAGGLEAIQGLLSALPDPFKMALVIVQHLDPHHESLMGELLKRQTSNPVVTAFDGCEVRAGHIYLIAPGDLLTLSDNRLRTEKFAEPRGVRRPIDVFLTSLAHHSGMNAVGVILSGTGSDGTQGVRDIKNNGGLVLVQRPEEAKYDGMPQSAITSGTSDLVVPVAEIIPIIEDFFARVGSLTSDSMSEDEFLKRVTRHLRNRTGHDFSEYKPGTLLRRIAVRMSVIGQERPADYLQHLIEDREEADRLFNSILINVTSFFRDDDVFAELLDTIIPDLIDRASTEGTLRIWVAGCATGEEAYSLAIVISEAMERLNKWPHIAIFATDIDEDALRKARRGEYGNDIAERVSDTLLQKYFQPHPNGYLINETLRNMIRFSTQSLIKDPPFSQIDLITCRNVLIYFQKSLQSAASQTFHYCLRENGILVLGTSETIIGGQGLFEDVSQTHRIFRRVPGPAARLELRQPDHSFKQAPRPAIEDTALPVAQPYSADVMNHFAPPYMVLAAPTELVYASAKATEFLRVTAGRPQLSVLNIIRPELEPVISRLLRLRQKREQNQNIVFEGDLDGTRRRVLISSRQIENRQTLVVFEDQPLDISTAPASRVDVSSDTQNYLRELEAELDAARDRLRTIKEELETSNEELKSSNEEMMSMNEELQSANEELTTTNDELNSKIGEIRDANADMTNFIKSAKIGTIFLDQDLRLRRFTPEARKQFRFVTSDIGRPLDDIGSDLDVSQILDDCRAVLTGSEMMETEYTSREGQAFRARIVPFESEMANLSGVVISIFDVTELRHLAREAEAQRVLSEQRLKEIENLYNISPQAMGVVSSDLTYIRANQRLADITGFAIDDLLGRSLGSIAPSLRNIVEPLAKDVLENQSRIENKQLRGTGFGELDSQKVWETDWYPVMYDDNVAGVGLNVRDITEQVRTQFELRRVMQELQHRVKNMLANVLALVSRASRDSTVDKEVFTALARRIQALAQTHKLLTQSNWSSANLHQVLEPELTAVYGAHRVRLKGPEIIVNARAALSLGMAIHELATNAAKYGAFSVPEGEVQLSWLRQDDGETDNYIFTWKEVGGPPPEEQDTDGFGTMLIRSTITGSLNGEVAFHWEPNGLRCVLEVPASALIEIPNESLFNSLEI